MDDMCKCCCSSRRSLDLTTSCPVAEVRGGLKVPGCAPNQVLELPVSINRETGEANQLCAVLREVAEMRTVLGVRRTPNADLQQTDQRPRYFEVETRLC